MFSESAPTFPNYDTGFPGENIRLEKDVLSKLGVRYIHIYMIKSLENKYSRVQDNCMFFQWEIVFGHQLKIQGKEEMFVE